MLPQAASGQALRRQPKTRYPTLLRSDSIDLEADILACSASLQNRTYVHVRLTAQIGGKLPVCLTLKKIMADGLGQRKDYGEIPPRVDYSLTVRGRSLKPVLQAMEEWARVAGTRE
jgi:hypothetical protein